MSPRHWKKWTGKGLCQPTWQGVRRCAASILWQRSEADDCPEESREIRFQRHDRFMRMLREDALLMVDGFRVAAPGDDSLDAMLLQNVIHNPMQI